MLKIRAIKILVNTQMGLFGVYQTFTSGLNLIRANNTNGKSTLFQAILYGLGLEELIGGKNEKTMQSVLKDKVVYKDTVLEVLESQVFLEIENKEIITIQRTIKSNKSPKLVEVYKGNLLTGSNQKLDCTSMYLHDKNAAQYADFGFHAFLEEFLGWNLPIVNYTNTEPRKLYLQTIFPAFIIEQKMGWSDFLATIPIYGLRNAEARVIEFILNLDVWQNEKLKQELTLEKQRFNANWDSLFSNFQNLARRGNCEVKGMTNQPQIINNFESIYLVVRTEDKQVLIDEYVKQIQRELEILLKKQETGKVSENINKNESLLYETNNTLDLYSLNLEQLINTQAEEKEKLKELNKQLFQIEDDLRKNKAINKVQSLGSEMQLYVAQNTCPSCKQLIKDTLLSQDVNQIPMNIDENIKYLDSQKSMTNAYIEGQKSAIDQRDLQIHYLKEKLSELRQKVRNIKKELISDERLPSELEIEQKLNLKKRIEFYNNLQEDFNSLLERLKVLVKEWTIILSKQEKLPKELLSKSDWFKIRKLQEKLQGLVSRFGYQSKSVTEILISIEKYLPVIENYNLRFDSSGSDFIRSIWAYTCALYLTAKELKGNHPFLLMFDEPSQQEVSVKSFNSFLKELESYSDCQTIVAASFKNSDEMYRDSTVNVNFNLIKFDDRVIQPMDN